MSDGIAPAPKQANRASPPDAVSPASQILGDFAVAYAVGILVFAGVAGAISIATLGADIGTPVFFIVALGAVYLSFPALLVSVLILLIFRKHISRNLIAWCLAAPFVVTVVHFAFEYALVFGGRDPFIHYLSLSDVWERAGFSLTVAIIAAVTFYWIHARRGRDR